MKQARLLRRRPPPRPTPRTTRLVRFGYRRPPPWSRASPVEESDPPPPPPTTWHRLINKTVQLTPIPAPSAPSLPTLSHGLETVLRGDGVYPLEAPWTLSGHRRAPLLYADSLRRIVQPERIAWHNIPPYIPAAEDGVLKEVAKANGAKYYSSTSSVTSALAALYHLLSNFKDTELVGGLSQHLSEMPAHFAKMHRRPVAVMLHNDDGVWSVTSHGGEGTGPSILRDLGHSLERMLTTDPEDFSRRYVSGEECVGEEQFYHYSKTGKMLLRAQIDCVNDRTGEVFDVKTRAVAPIRYDLVNYMAFRKHRLRFLRGRSDSYEREFYDMVRSVFLKYALQLRIGRMHGALVAYHNTTEILGLEYVPLTEIEQYVFGGRKWADIAFGSAIKLLERVLDVAAEVGGGKVIFYNEWSKLKMYVFVQSVDGGDEFGAHTFACQVTHEDTQRIRSPANELSGAGMYHLDAQLYRTVKGVSMIGPHKEMRGLGARKLPDEVALPKRKHNASFDHNEFDQKKLRQVLRVWELQVFPTVNGTMMSRTSGRVDDNDEFALFWDLQEVQVKKEHLAKFVASLGRIYTQ